jgi:uncharacterized protein
MSLSVHAITVPVFVRALTNLSSILDKAAAHCEQKKIDPSVLLNMRLSPDMFPLTRQVQIACDFAKGASARLAGQAVPKWDDTEASIADLKARIQKTIDFVQTMPAAQIDAAPGRNVSVTMRGEDKSFESMTYLLQMALPNFWFHTTTAYAILRHAGVDIGKRDFIGPV